MIACADGIVIFIDCIAERKEALGYTSIAGTEGRVHFSERRGLWEYGPLVEADEGYGTRYDSSPSPTCRPSSHSTTTSIPLPARA